MPPQFCLYLGNMVSFLSNNRELSCSFYASFDQMLCHVFYQNKLKYNLVNFLKFLSVGVIFESRTLLELSYISMLPQGQLDRVS